MTDASVVIAWLAARFWLVIAVVCLIAGVFVGRWSNQPDAVQQAEIDGLKAQSAILNAVTQNAKAGHDAAIATLAQLQEEKTADSLRLVALAKRRIPTPVLASEPVPDTCRPLVVRYVEQLALRDSIHEIDSLQLVRATVALKRLDLAALDLRRALATEQVGRHFAETKAIEAVRALRPPRLELELEPAVQVPDLRLSARAAATVGLGDGWQVTGGYVGTLGEAGTWQVGVRKTVRVL